MTVTTKPGIRDPGRETIDKSARLETGTPKPNLPDPKTDSMSDYKRAEEEWEKRSAHWKRIDAIRDAMRTDRKKALDMLRQDPENIVHIGMQIGENNDSSPLSSDARLTKLILLLNEVADEGIDIGGALPGLIEYVGRTGFIADRGAYASATICIAKIAKQGHDVSEVVLPLKRRLNGTDKVIALEATNALLEIFETKQTGEMALNALADEFVNVPTMLCEMPKLLHRAMTERNIDIMPLLPKILDGFKSHSKEVTDGLKRFFEALLTDEKTKEQTLLVLIRALDKKNEKVRVCALKLLKGEMKKGGRETVRFIAITATKIIQSPEFVGQANANSPYFVKTITGMAMLMAAIEKKYARFLED